MTNPHCPLLSKKTLELLSMQWRALKGEIDQPRDEDGKPINFYETFRDLHDSGEFYAEDPVPVPEASE